MMGFFFPASNAGQVNEKENENTVGSKPYRMNLQK